MEHIHNHGKGLSNILPHPFTLWPPFQVSPQIITPPSPQNYKYMHWVTFSLYFSLDFWRRTTWDKFLWPTCCNRIVQDPPPLDTSMVWEFKKITFGWVANSYFDILDKFRPNFKEKSVKMPKYFHPSFAQISFTMFQFIPPHRNIW